MEAEHLLMKKGEIDAKITKVTAKPNQRKPKLKEKLNSKSCWSSLKRNDSKNVKIQPKQPSQGKNS